jgi:hypothetical protein
MSEANGATPPIPDATGGAGTDAAAAAAAAAAATVAAAAAKPPEGTATPDPNAKPADDKPADDKPADAVVPEKYEFVAPEGVALDTEVLTELEAFARSHKLSQADAQAIADLGVKAQSKWIAALGEAQKQQAAQWVDALVKDPELGGTDHEEKKAIAALGAKALLTDADRKFADDSGLGNHPLFVRMAYRHGLLLQQDTPPGKGGGENTGGAPRVAKSIYNHPTSKHTE